MQPHDFIEEKNISSPLRFATGEARACLEAELNQTKSQLSQTRTQLHETQQQLAELKQQLDWLKRQVFGQKSEKQIIAPPEQGQLFERPAQAEAPANSTLVQAHPRRSKQRPEDCVEDTGLRFDGSVPVETIEILPPELRGPQADEYEIIGFEDSHKLAMRPGSYVILRQRIAKVRHKANSRFVPTPEVPGRVLDRCVVDVSTLAGLMVDKACYHLPLYRQHQRMQAAGVTLSRASLSNWVSRAIELLRPIAQAQHHSVLQSSTLAMDEVPMKAGRSGPGKMQQTYFWPLYGESYCQFWCSGLLIKRRSGCCVQSIQ